ncbi:hypothetical protein SAMN02990966_07333 [Rhodospirillales bacterium URHD0017]|nr:hypothetical protein SAMN02990966_07333 [Rhodospirillales bacterium URHD0017]
MTRLIEFGSAVDALAAAIDFQRATAEPNGDQFAIVSFSIDYSVISCE